MTREFEHDPADGCDACPFYDDGDGGYGAQCNLDESLDPPNFGPAPPLCPLREGPVVVKAPQ